MNNINSQVPQYVRFHLFVSSFLSLFAIYFSTYYFFVFIIYLLLVSLPIPVAARSRAWVYGRSLVKNEDSNPAGSMDVCLLSVLCVVRQRSLRRADHSSSGALPTVDCT